MNANNYQNKYVVKLQYLHKIFTCTVVVPVILTDSPCVGVTFSITVHTYVPLSFLPTLSITNSRPVLENVLLLFFVHVT